jgi:hypothetical protein
MTDQPLSPAAQAVWHAYETTNCDPYLIDPRRAGVAAALRAAVDQLSRSKFIYTPQLLAIAAELD